LVFWHCTCQIPGHAAVNDRTIRSLAHLEDTASTARVLNLLRVYHLRRLDPQHAEKPFFRNATLNKGIFLKHRLRRNERELFFDGRRTATKVIIPIDGGDLKLGGRFAFVDQINFEGMMSDLLGDNWLYEGSDRQLLSIIDKMPSLDPFLLREQLRRHGRDPARCYFEISDSDMKRMFRFVEREIEKLIELCYKDSRQGYDERLGSRLVKKILSSTVDGETEPLRLTLRLEKLDYQEGVFCWKGFLYYKWTLTDILADVARVADAVGAIKPRGSVHAEAAAAIAKARVSLKAAILRALESARKSLRIYDAAFAGLIDGRPQSFRDFLLAAPSMFWDLGERLGAVNHIVSFWNYRFPPGRLPVVSGSELADILADFSDSLAFGDVNAGAAWLDG
jgi:hypothetical protein